MPRPPRLVRFSRKSVCRGKFRAGMWLNLTLSNRSNNRHEEAWMINLGRDGNDEWLLKQRDPDEWFTGLKPEICPGVDVKGAIRSLPLPKLDAVTRQSAKDYFNNSWTLYETLFAGFKGEEGFYRPPPHGLRHPQIFYYGHTACLYINKLRVSGVLPKPVHAYFESIFEIGVDEMLWDDMHKNDMLWPTVKEVHEYRQQVYDVVVDAILNHPSLDDSNGPVKVDQSHPMWALFMGYEHERIHLETSSVLFRETPYHLVQAPENWPPLHPSASGDRPSSNPIQGVHYPKNRMIPVNKGTVDLGKPADFPSFGWDNEYGERNLDVPDFQASEFMVTNGEFYEFVESGDYRNKENWCDDGWAWRTHRNMKWPFFWEPDGPAGAHEYKLRTIFKVVDMPWDWPVDVNYYEASAFCRWKVRDVYCRNHRLFWS
jgi:5-histidylcysteine sulfoxide synthase